MTKNLRLLHTSDWHLGRLLYGRKRYAEFAAFLDWLLDTLRAEGIDVLLVAGDIFDTTTPSNAAQTPCTTASCAAWRQPAAVMSS
jgi:exonuclease SbcD